MISKNILINTLGVVAIATAINAFVNVPLVWYAIDVLFILIPIVYTFSYMKGEKKGGIVAILLWVPAVVVVYMAANGLLSTPHVAWSITNMYVALVYAYLVGSRGEIRC